MSGPDKSPAEVSKLFNSWSSNTIASIVVDGQKLNDVFSLIKQQLDYLLKRQIAMDQQLAAGVLQAAAAPAPAPAPEPAPVGYDPIRRLTMPAPMATLDPLVVEGLQNEMENLKLLMRNSSETADKKLAAMEKWVQLQIKANESKMDAMAQSVAEQLAAQESNMHRVDQLETSVRQLSHMLAAMNEHILTVDKDLANHIKESSIQFNQIKDSLAVHDLRAKHFESRVSTATSLVEKLQAVIDGYPAKYFDNIYREIGLLTDEKANRLDLDTKAEMAMLFNKADLASVTALESLTEELDRRLCSLKMETVDKVSHLDIKMDRRVDKIVSYCLKELRKELKNFAATGAEEEAPEGTDIGKVRCLVCNQATSQAKLTETVFGGPQMRNTMRVRHTSPSPPPNSRFPLSPQETGRPMASERPDSAKPRHGRLVKLGATLESNNNDDDEFQYHSRPQAGIRYQGQGEEQETLVQITSHAHAEGYRPAANAVNRMSKGAGNYKDVEERLVSKKSNPSSQAVKQVEVMMHRPKSAPMRRIGNASKLQPMGLTTPVR